MLNLRSHTHQALDLDAKSTLLLKSEHHKAVWSLCLNTLTDRPIQSALTYLCSVRPPASGLARFPFTMTKYLDYHHVYSYITTSKNLFVPCSNSGHTTHHNTDNFLRFVSLPAGLVSLRKNKTGQSSTSLQKG